MTKNEKAAYWRQQVDGFQASGLSVKNYCAQEARVRQFIGKNRQFRNAAPAFIGVSAPIF